MSGKGTTQTQTSTVTKDPWSPAQPALNGILSGAMNAYGSGVGSQVYQGPRVAGIGDTTQAGLDYMKANANAGQGAAQAGNNYLGGLLQNGGATAAGNTALGQMLGVGTVNTSGVQAAADRMGSPNSAAAQVGNSLIGGKYAQDASGYQNLATGLGSQTQTSRSLQDVASGKYLQEGGNPYLDRIAGESAAQAAASVAGRYAASGRYGSGRFASATADAVSRAENELRYSDYNTERQRQAEAANAIDSQANARTGILSGLYGAQNDVRTANAGQAVTGANLASQADQAALTGASAVANLQQANNTQRIGQYNAAIGSAQADRAAAMAGLGAVATNNANLMQPGKTLAGIGGVEDAARQQLLDSQREVFDEQQNAPWRQLGLYSSLVNPIASMGGTQNGTQTTTTPQPGLLQQLMGGLSTGVGLLGQTGAFPTAAAGAGSAGWLASALPFLASDERVKEDVRPVGELNDGQTVYSYRYKGDPTPQIGLLAQEVAKRNPDAVGVMPSGILGVNYEEATDASARLAKGSKEHRGFGFPPKGKRR